MCGIIEMTRATRDVASHVDVRNGEVSKPHLVHFKTSTCINPNATCDISSMICTENQALFKE